MIAVLSILFGVLLFIGIIGIGGAYISFWFYGLMAGLAHFGVPMTLGFFLILILVILGRALGTLVLAVFGLWASVTVLGWPLIYALAIYAMWLLALLGALVFGGSIAVFGGVVLFFGSLFKSARRRR